MEEDDFLEYIDLDDIFGGCILLRKDGTSVNALDVLKDKCVGIYFNAERGSKYAQFSPQLSNFYEEVKNQDFTILYVNCDKNKEDFNKDLDGIHPDWFYLSWKQEQKREELVQLFKVEATPWRHLPMFVVVKNNGCVASELGYDEIKMFGPPSALLNNWINNQEKFPFNKKDWPELEVRPGYCLYINAPFDEKRVSTVKSIVQTTLYVGMQN